MGMQSRTLLTDVARTIRSGGRADRFAVLRQFRRGRQCGTALVLAAGPSVQYLDASVVKRLQLEGRLDVFAVNQFPLSPLAHSLEPVYLVMSDPFTSRVNELMDTLRLRPPRALLVPEDQVPTYSTLPCEVVPFNDLAAAGSLSKNINPERPRSYASLTAYKALALAVYRGYHEIYILGFDYSYVRNVRVASDNSIYEWAPHFDGYPTPGQPAEGTKQQSPNVGMHLLRYGGELLDLFRFTRAPIGNLDADSLTDAFPKIAQSPLLVSRTTGVKAGVNDVIA